MDEQGIFLHTVQNPGLYRSAYEHDSCGIGFVADIKGRKSHTILQRGLEVLTRLEHRGAESADNKTGDGAGVLLHIPHALYKKYLKDLPPEGSYGTGLVFLPKDTADELVNSIDAYARTLTVRTLWRKIPVNSNVAGTLARQCEPDIRQIFLIPEKLCTDIELELYTFRKKIERIYPEVYIVSLSSRVITYKGMLMPTQLPEYYPELTDSACETAVALVHSRFSTNTFPNWPLAQPFRLIAHNGEINTIKGNRFWMQAREQTIDPSLVPILESNRSDSASFDNALELLVKAGRTLPHALMMLIPESWNDKNPIPPELKRFYEYHACFMEPWDGPASLVFCDGRYVGGMLDRNGLRPSRYTITKDDCIVMASETGVQDFKAEEVVYKGRLLPGKLLLVDLEAGRIIPDAEAKETVYMKAPYSPWVSDNVVTLDQTHEAEAEIFSEDHILFMERSFGWTREDIERLLIPMIETAQEPTASMGTDTPLAVFSKKNQRVYAYFKQIFAQVTNPAIDSIREDMVMTLTSFVGPQGNLLEESEAHCQRIKVKKPILRPDELKRLLALKAHTFKSQTLDASFYIHGDSSLLEPALDRLIQESVESAQKGTVFIVLSDRAALNPEANRCAVPALLAVGAVHHGLIRAGLRTNVSLIVESAEPREIMHFALLFGYGADLIVPYGVLAILNSMSTGSESKRIGTFDHAQAQYFKALHKAMLKVMSKMGTSTLRSYRGAQVFEAVGLSQVVIEKCFRGTESRIGGVTFADLESEVVGIYQEAKHAQGNLLTGVGQYRWRKNGEVHAWNPETISLLQHAVRSNKYETFKQFSRTVDTLNQSPHVIRGLLDFVQTTPIPIDDVESSEAIMRRFTTGAMSFGSISKEAHETIAAALNSIHGRSNSGEGGEDPIRFIPLPDGTSLKSAIKQVASGRFGVTSDYLAHADELQIKIAQGAKPGEGGQLPGHKVAGLVAKTRHATPGVTLISPPPHHDIYSIEDLAELIFDLKNANPRARISVKLVAETGVGTIAAGVAKTHADTILISGYDGGTGASPQSSIRHAGLPWEIGLAETNQTLVRNGLRGRVRLQTDGQLKTGRDIVIAGLLGAEEFGFGTAVLIALGCVMMRKCHENTCPAGIATQDPKLRERFNGKAEYLIRYFQFLAQETRELMALLGINHFDTLVGRSDLLMQRASSTDKSTHIDLSPLLYREAGTTVIPGGTAHYCVQEQIHKIDTVLDRTLIELCHASLDKKVPVAVQLPIHNTDRAVGAMLSYEISTRFGGSGLPDNFITVDFEGSAGQSFGAFLAKGVTFRLAGDSNDYVGKGLSGGRIVVAPPAGSTFKTNENILIGNTVLYGATSGELYAAGIAGERFGVRNSGAIAVVEGVGDHCAEYMTGGRLIVLGKVGRNFAAGMSGGIAYVLDLRGDFNFFLNKGMVELSGLEHSEDELFVREYIAKHGYWTGSHYAQTILDHWAENRHRFVKILPVEYKRALQRMLLADLDKKLYEIREREALEERQ
ncbi:MAG: glutamate synthase large subunit [Treponema sp.]|jgi:glutamate synthase (NADPH/NADH) large chain|nr:glutamate synthase large subunit [Treponema sp.]